MAKAAEDAVFLNQIQSGIGVVGGLLLLATMIANVVSAYAGRAAAQAARDAADIAVTTEMPRLRIMKVTIAGEGNSRERFAPLKIDITIQNFGRTPAFVTDWLVDAIVTDEYGEGLPITPAFRGLVRVERDLEMPVVARDTPAVLRQDDEHSPRFTGEKADAFLSGECFLIIYGIIIFEDFIGTKYERGFAVRWDPAAYGHPEGCATWDQPGYNFQRKLDPEEAKHLSNRA